MSDCSADWLCCQWEADTQSWRETNCSCTNDNVFSQQFEMCTWPDLCGAVSGVGVEAGQQDYTCQGGLQCPGYP